MCDHNSADILLSISWICATHSRMFLLRNFLQKKRFSTSFTSPITLASTLIFLLISAASTSICRIFAFMCESFGISCYTVTEACTENNQKITLMLRQDWKPWFRAYQPYLYRERSSPGKSTLAHQSYRRQEPGSCEPAHVLPGSAPEITASAANKNKRFLCLC